MTESSRQRSGEPEQPATGSDARTADPLIGRVLDGRYKITSLIAVGGMGRVYRAEQSSLGRTVAVKVLSIPASASLHDPRFQERFALEAAAASKLSHANNVTTYDYGRTDDGVFYIAMEFVDGIPLSRVLKAERRLHPVRALSIARQVCRALREAHNRHVIHRDLKPSNILLVHQGDEGEQVKVLDFGLAKIMDESQGEEGALTRVGTFLGTPEYAAPELSRFGRSDVRSDIYSVGVLLYRMLAGRVPFRGPTDTASILAAVNDPVPPLESNLDIPKRVESLVMKCLEKEPIRRYQSMEELLPALGTCLMELGVESASLIQPSMVVKSPVQLDNRAQSPEVLQLDLDEPPSSSSRVTPWIIGGCVALVVVGAVVGMLPGRDPVELKPSPAQAHTQPVVPTPAMPEMPAASVSPDASKVIPPMPTDAPAMVTPVPPAPPPPVVTTAPPPRTSHSSPVTSRPPAQPPQEVAKVPAEPRTTTSSRPPESGTTEAVPSAAPVPEGYKPSPY